MRTRLALALSGAMLLSALVLLLLAGGVLGQTDPPASGDWTVADTTVVSGQTVDLRGDLTVTPTGHLTLESVTLRIHVASNGEHGIEVQAGGTLIIKDTDDDPSTTGDASTVTAEPNTRSYYWINRADCTLRVSNSLVTRCGHTGMVGSLRLGIHMATDDAVFSGVAIDDNLHGIVLDHATVTLTDTSITNCTYHGVNAQDSDLTMTGCTLADNGYEGARIVRGDATLTRCSIITNRNGIVARQGANLTLADSLVKGSADGVLGQIGPHVTVRNCTFRAQTQYGIEMENQGTLSVFDSVIGGATRTALYIYNQITVTSSGSTYQNNVYGARLKTQCTLTSTGDIFKGNTNSGIYLEDTADLVIVGGLFTGNSAGIKGGGDSSIISWDTTVEECTFEGYSLDATDLELHDGHIINCTGGAVAPDYSSSTSWTVHSGNASSLVNSNMRIGDIDVHGDLVMSQATVIFGPGWGRLECDGGEQDWQNVTLQPGDPGETIDLDIRGSATGTAWHLTLTHAQYPGSPASTPRVMVPFEFHVCTFHNVTPGFHVYDADVIFDRCLFTGNTNGVMVMGGESRFENCTFSVHNQMDVAVYNDGHAVLVNCSFDPYKLSAVDIGAKISVWWLINIHAEFPSGYAAVGATVEINDANENVVFTGTTNGAGDIYQLLILEHVTDGAGKDDRTPHNFTATKGLSTVILTTHVTSHKKVVLVLQDPYPPVLTVTSHSDGDHIGTSTLVLQGTATDSGSSVFRVEARVSTQSWSLATGTDTWEWTHTFSADGTYPLSVRARDYALNEVVVYLNITVDTDPPDIVMQVPPSPANNSLVGSDTATLVGWVDKADVLVTAGNVTATMDGTEFTLVVTLVDGLNVIVIRAEDPAGNTASLEWHLSADLDAPPLTLTRPVNGSVFNTTTVVVEGQTSPYIDVYYRVLEDDTSWSLHGSTSATGVFAIDVDRLVQGENHIEVMVEDSAENRAIAGVVVILDTAPPTLVSATPADGTHLRFPWLNLTGTFSEPIRSMRIGTHQATVNGSAFAIDVPLLDGTNSLTLVATDQAGNTGIVRLAYVLDTVLPVLTVEGLVWNATTKAFDPVHINLQYVQLVGSTEVGNELSIDMWEYDVDEAGRFVADLELSEDENVLQVLVTDRAGNELATTITLVLDTLAPVLTVDRPVDRTHTDWDFVWVVGTISKGDRVTIGSQTLVSTDGTFRVKVRLPEAVNLIVVVGSDLAGNEVSIERLVFISDSTEGITGNAFLDENCNSLLLIMLIAIIAVGVIVAFMWRGEDVFDRREQALAAVMEEDGIELDKPHLEPTSGYLQYDPTSPTGRRPEFEERDTDEEFVSMAEFRKEFEEEEEHELVLEDRGVP